MKQILVSLTIVSSLFAVVNIPHTAQNECYDNNSIINCENKSSNFYGQDGICNYNSCFTPCFFFI